MICWFRIDMKFLQNFKFVFYLGFLASQVKSQLSTTGYVYEPVSGNDQEGSISSERFTTYHECWGMGECGFVAKRTSDGIFVKLRIGAMLNNTKYSKIWKKRIEGRQICYLFIVTKWRILRLERSTLFLNHQIPLPWKLGQYQTWCLRLDIIQGACT